MRNLRKIRVKVYDSERNSLPWSNSYLPSDLWISLHQIFPFLEIPSVHTFSEYLITAHLDNVEEIKRGWYGEPH
jgi:hypothetical protein